ncbi:MAG TPA: L,D-transpeptidase [Longimicrobiaceae bacterium]|nr:L,D-transpeptidase [Longimicrobiaceae bacterium]
MTEPRRGLSRLRHEHPVFFWGMTTLLLLLAAATGVVAARIPRYQGEARELNRRMTAAERAARDRILQSQAARSELAVALLRRELRIRSLEQKRLHLALSTDDSTLSLRHGGATLRAVKVQIGPDSTVRAPDGRTWRFVRALGERRVREKQVSPTYTIPEWVYVARGQPVPPEEERRVEGALGEYVLRLDDGTEIYSRPEAGPFAEGVKPASFVVRERDLRAIFDAVRIDTPVFIY